MIIVSIIAVLILFFSFIGGIKEGVVKSFFGLLILVIALAVAGRFYHFIANLLSFLPGQDWENFLGFFITLALTTVILHFIFFIPRKILQAIWSSGIIYRFLGGILNYLSTAIGLTVFALVIMAYPIWTWLETAIRSSGVFMWLVTHLSFVQTLMPDIMQQVTRVV